MFARRALLAAVPAALLGGCGPSTWQTGASERGATPSVSPSAEPAASPSASPTPSPSPSKSATKTAAPPDVHDVNWYLKQVPQFGPAPAPEVVSVPGGDSTPWWSRVPTTHRVAFITIDDGGGTRTNDALELIKRARIPVTLFLNSPAAAAHTSYFKAIKDTGASIQNHTVTHRKLKGQSYDFQYKEINDCANKIQELFGVRPYLFRPPFGDYDAVTLKAARASGMRVSFFWKQTVNDGIVRYQSGDTIKPGDVMLMHFRPNLADDLLASLKAMHRSGLTPARLEDYLPRPAV